jgi:tetratricopeptide (TPR) repeat protein
VANQESLRRLDNNKKSKLPIVLVVLLVLAVFLVVFVLPKTTPRSTLSEQAANESQIISSVQEPTPLELAEQRKARSQAQKILNDLLPIRDELINRNIDRWGAEEFDSARSELEIGERLYARGKYREALGYYEQAYTSLQLIQRDLPKRIEKNIERGQKALLELDHQDASKAFQMALLMDSGNHSAQKGFARASSLPLTAPLWQQAKIDIENKQWSEAEKKLNEILAKDPEFVEASKALSALQIEIEEQTYNRYMSKGFQALSGGELEKATTAFELASRQRPESQDVKTALEQLATAKIDLDIANHFTRAEQFSQKEMWQQAVDVYDQMLTKYPDLAEIKAARIPAVVRAGIDQRFKKYIQEPLKLGNSQRYRNAESLLSDMQSISNPGPKLTQQIRDLDETLIRIKTPVEVILLSDNVTNVEVFRVGQFGSLTEKTLKLTPGHYVAAGNRRGYRDVQVEFTIDGLDRVAPIEVICTEPI